MLKTCPSSHPEPQPLRAVWIRGAPLLAAEAGRLINLLVPLINLLVPLSNDLGLDEDDIFQSRVCMNCSNATPGLMFECLYSSRLRRGVPEIGVLLGHP